MSKKFGKLLLLTAVTGLAAYGTYTYLQKKDKLAGAPAADDEDDDFDDFSEDLDEDIVLTKERSYVPLNFNLDKAEAIATEAFQKAKEVISDSVQQVKETVKSVADSQGYHTSFTDITSTAKDVEPTPVPTPVAAEPTEDVETTETEDAAILNETVDATDTNETVEEFFDDDEV